MNKRIHSFVTALVAVLAFVPSMMNAQEQMVVVTREGDVQTYPASSVGTFAYDAEQDIYTIQAGGQTVTFGGRDVKHIYFADKAETDIDPYIVPQATDKYNPNFELLTEGTYELLSMDKELGRMKVLFQDDVPQLYVGKILSLRDSERNYNCFVLAHKVDGKTADICFRFAQIAEVLYNTELVLATDPADSYFQTTNAKGKQIPVYGPRRRATDLAEVDIKGAKVTLYADMGINLATQDNSKLKVDAKMKLYEPRQNEKSKRSFLAKIDYMGVVARGTYEKTTTLTMTPQLGLKLEKDDYRKTPIFKAPPIEFGIPAGPILIPVTLDLSATLGYNIQADINAEMELQQETTTGLTMTAGVEYDGNQTTPIFDVSPIFNPKKPQIVSKQGTVTARFSPYLRLDLLIDVVFGAHVDLMPYLQATYKGVARQGVDDFGSFELEAGGNLRGGLYLNVPFLDDDDYASAMTEDPIKKVIYKSPADIKPKDAAQVNWCSMNSTVTRDYQTTATLMDEEVIPDWGQEHAVMQSWETDMPDGQIIEVVGGMMQAPRRTVVSPPLPAPVELHATGEEWATQCDENGVAHTSMKCRVPLGYRTILKTRIMGGDGNTIKELVEEFPNEIKNFNATVSFDGVNGSIQYRNGGSYIYEDLADLKARYTGGVIQVYAEGLGWVTPEGMKTTPIAGAMQLFEPQVLQTYDYCLWMKEVLNHPTPGFTFSEKNILGYPCKTVTIPEGSLTYWQNILMEVTSDDATFRVTSLEILDNPDEP